MTSDAHNPGAEPMPQSVVLALRRKYQRMLEMRRLNDSGVEHDARGLMRELAAEFPGALREIDLLALATIEDRLRALDDVIQCGGDVALWMRCVADYHAMLRAALRIKRMALPRHDLVAALQALAGAYVPGEGEPRLDEFDEAMLGAVLNPAEGRLNPWLCRLLEQRYGIATGGLDRLLFPAPQKA